MRKIMILFAAVLIGMAANAKELKKLVVTTSPQMVCSSCENKIKGNIRFEKGVKKIETDIENQRVTITYDSEKNNDETLIKAFEKFGYKAVEVSDGCKTEGDGCGSGCCQGEKKEKQEGGCGGCGKEKF